MATSSSSQTALPQSASTATSPAVPTSASPSPTTPSGSPLPGSSGLAKSAIAGIAIGVTVGIAVIALLAYIAWTLHGKRRAAGHVGLPAVTQYPEQAGEMQYDMTRYTDTEPTEMDAVQQRAVYELKAH
ncbi:hypothetical protein J1614_009789 [Plenodomus biglobosus]|nr:hypothetical protein J1614_009789 [Plenodomus biglobosus]